MNIKIINSIPNMDVSLNRSDNGDLNIVLSEKCKVEQDDKKVSLGSFKPGSVVKLGNREYIVLGHGKDTTAVITKDVTDTMEFGENNDYKKSYIRKYCNNKFYKELVKAVGKDNIVQHKVNLTADDGTGKGIVCKDNVSILTTALYRRYREYLSAYESWWWTATPVSSDNPSYSRYVCFVRSDGILSWNPCDYCDGVRPFCILNSSILVS